MAEDPLALLFDPRPPGPRPPGPRVRPKDAATLILIRRDGPAPQVLMGRRNQGHVFMPNRWVFPGGRLDRSDFHAPFASDLRPEVAAALERSGAPARRMRALALAAVRETFEEAGLLLARPAPPRIGAGPWREFLAHGALPDLEALDFIARAVTPPHVSGRRFDARFFMADAGRLIRLERLPDCGELDTLAWFTLEETRAIEAPAVTRFVLGEVARRLGGEAGPAPYLRFRHGAPQVSYG
jgi:8-oxo-dGTP pyrophosphatase MutT (NUDIX family)